MMLFKHSGVIISTAEMKQFCRALPKLPQSVQTFSSPAQPTMKQQTVMKYIMSAAPMNFTMMSTTMLSPITVRFL